MVLRSPLPLRSTAPTLGTWLRHWARSPTADRVFLAERDGEVPSSPWIELTYGAARAKVRAVAQALLDRGLPPRRPIAVLAENGIDHALLTLAALEVGIAVAPVSTAYARPGHDHSKLRTVLDMIGPRLLYVDDVERHGSALASLDLHGIEVVASRSSPGLGTTPFADLLATGPTDAVDAAAAAVRPDTVAKIMFTSGSTGAPKGVINTHLMLCSNQDGIAQLWPFLERSPPILLDWLPWHHTFGGNFDFNMVLRNGGTLHIDRGKPMPGLFATSLENLRSVSPTVLPNVARGFAALVEALEADENLNRHVFGDLDLILYAAAALPQSLWSRLEALSRRARGRVVPMVSAWGMTETAPMATMVHYPVQGAGIIGLPAPGIAIRLAPVDDRLEAQVRGPNVTPGYWGEPALTAAAFTGGWLRTGDAVRLADPDDPTLGLVFDGRIGENFKLASGTWVNVGVLRVAILTAAPLLSDVVIAGHERDEIAVLGFPNFPACRAVAGVDDAMGVEAVLGHEAVRLEMAAALARHNAAMPAGSTRIVRAMLMVDPPSMEHGEITDKGYINQRAVLTRRADLVGRLFEPRPDPRIILPT